MSTDTNPDSKSAIDLPNPLLYYPSYTYSLSLHLLSQSDWNNIVETGEYTATNVLIASGGRYNYTNFIRNQFFNEDFYIDDLTIDSVIASTEGNTGSNSLNYQFTVIEPYGVTLLDRIIAANLALEPAQPNYLDSAYLLQIDFFGSDDTANLVHPIPNQTKYLPLKLIAMDISVDSKGSEYKFTGTPYTHDAFSQSKQQTPMNFEITADTVQQFFSMSGSTSSSNSNDQRNEAPVKTGYGSKYKVRSYASSVNEWQNSLVNSKDIEIADVIDFVFDNEIASAKLVETGKLPPRSAPYSDISTRQAIAKGDFTGLAADINFNIKKYPVNTGDSIESVLYNVIRNSSYILSQIVNPADYNGDLNKYIAAKQNLENEPFWWFKIVPVVTIIGYDKLRNRYARNITYYVQKYAIRNMKVDFAPGGTATSPIKVYNYLYTGANKDIIELDIKFNAAFYTAVTTEAGKLMTAQGAANSIENIEKVDSASQQVTPNSIQPIQKNPTVGDQRYNAVGGALTGKAVLAGDAVKSIMNNAQGDMLNINLKILGDPMYIKQDDTFYKPVQNDPVTSALTQNNSIKTDNGQVYVQVMFKVPSDYDETTGLMRFDPRFSQSLFSGMYTVVTIKSEFSKGKFTQALDLVRLPNQTSDDYVNQTSTDNSAEQRSGV